MAFGRKQSSRTFVSAQCYVEFECGQCGKPASINGSLLRHLPAHISVKMLCHMKCISNN